MVDNKHVDEPPIALGTSGGQAPGGRLTPPSSARFVSLGAALFFALLAVVMTWPRFPDAGTSVVDYGDPLTNIWRLRWTGNALFSDFPHLYDAPIFHGYPNPLAYDNILVGPSILARALTPLTGSIELTYNLMVMASFALAAWCAFLLARHVTGSALAGLVAGVVFGFWSYTFAHISHLAELSLYPMPLALLCLHRLFETPGTGGLGNANASARSARGRIYSPAPWAAGFAALFIWQSLHSFYYAAYLALLSGALALWELLITRQWRDWSPRRRWYVVASLLLAWLLSGAALAIFSAPYREAQAQLGLYRTREEQVAWSARLTDYLSVSPRSTIYRGVLPNAWPEPLFPGFASLALGGVGMVALALRARRRRGKSAPLADEGTPPAISTPMRGPIGFYALVAVGAIVLSLGPVWRVGSSEVPLPYSVLSALPGFNGLRAPGRLASVAALGWGVLAGWGWLYLSAFVRRRNPAPKPLHNRQPIGTSAILVGTTLAALALIIVMCVEQWTVPTPSVPLPPKRADSLLPQGEAPPVYSWLATQKDSGALAEFPLSTDATGTYIRMYFQGIHNHPLLNGHSSFVPPTYPEIARVLDEPVEIGPMGIGMLQSLDVRYISFYHWAYKESDWQRKMESLTAYPEVQPAGEFEEDTAFTLAPLDEAAQMRLGWRLPQTMPAAATVPITVTLTNVYAYPLLTRLHTSLPLEVRWSKGDAYGASLPVSVIQASIDTPLTLEQGAHLFSLVIATPQESGVYQLDLRATWPLPHYKPNPPMEVKVGP